MHGHPIQEEFQYFLRTSCESGISFSTPSTHNKISAYDNIPLDLPLSPSPSHSSWFPGRLPVDIHQFLQHLLIQTNVSKQQSHVPFVFKKM